MTMAAFRRGVAGFWVTALVSAASCSAIDNGLGRLPPMGWRSWNAFNLDITQEKMIAAANAFVDKSYGVTLKDAGYWHVGLDDGFQACGHGIKGTFHNASGYPLINTSIFPSMNAMTDHIHSLELKAGWYANNCFCSEGYKSLWGDDNINHYKGDVNATIDFGFDGIKLDACGVFTNLSLWADLLNATGRPVLIENCHWGNDGPGTSGPLNPNNDSNWAPFNFFRVSADIQASYHSVMHNVDSILAWQPWYGSVDPMLVGPGKWGYGDMLEVGNLDTYEHDRTHFGLWVILSQPLILGHDITNATTNKRIWDIITNPHAIAVSQSYEGHPGAMVHAYVAPQPGPPPPPQTMYLWGVHFSPGDPSQVGWEAPQVNKTGPLKNGDFCVEAGPDAMTNRTQLTLGRCSGAANQTFEVDFNGSIFLAGKKSQGCVSVFQGKLSNTYMTVCPSVQSGQSDRLAKFFVMWPDGTICSSGGSTLSDPLPSKGGANARAYCLASRDQAITQNAGTRGLEALVTVYAKPQANGAVAVLAVNGDSNNQTIQIDFDWLHVTTKSFTVFDVWAQSPVKGTFSGSFTTDPVNSTDSRFYVFTPAH